MAVKTIEVRKGREKLNFWERIYLPELLRGLGVALRHFFVNTFTRKNRYTVTVRYPEQKKVYPERFRGIHRLMQRDDGQVRCVACMCCATVCPAEAIEIVAGEHEDPEIEKRPVVFNIDWMRCVYCGYCVEACPCDAIRMDSRTHPVPVACRDITTIEKQDLLARGGTSIAVQGGSK